MRRSPASLTALGLGLAVILFVSVNALSTRFLHGLRLDLTQQQLYSVSDGTRSVLGRIEEPVTLKFYYSRRLGQIVPTYEVYAQRVRELLQQYVDLSHGKVRLEELDPQPFSDVEDQATAAGLQGVPTEEGGDPVYFGLAGTNTTDDSETIPFFNLDREKFLEYDLTKAVQSLAFPKKKVVGLISSLQLDGDPMAQMQGRPSEPQEVIAELRQQYDVRNLGFAIDRVPDDVDVLMVVQPAKFGPAVKYAIDQFVLKGGHALIFADPNAEFAKSHPSVMQQQAASASAADIDDLLKAWGVELVKGKVVGDREAALAVNTGGPDRAESVDYLPWLGLQGDDINGSDPITGKLEQIVVATAGALQPVKDAKTKLEPLLRSSSTSMLIDVAKLQGRPDPATLLQGFKSDNQRYTIAARVTGPADTAFPDGPPKPEEGTPPPEKALPPQVKTAKQPIDVVLVADADMLDNKFWVQIQNFGGQQIAQPTAQNGDFVENAVDNLLGTGELINLRSRGSAVRPFLRVQQMQHDASDKYQARAQELQTTLRDAETKLAGVRGQTDDKGNLELTPEQQKTIDQFRGQIIQTRGELRQVRLALRQAVDRLKLELAVVNIGLVPALVALVAVAVGLSRLRRRRLRSPGS